MDRVILHSDLNNFYASVEILNNPELKDEFVAVSGSTEERHGIVLAKNEKAKKLGIKTGMTLVEAYKICPKLVAVEANMDKYLSYSTKVRKIYSEYTDVIEPFGIDEAWLDVTHSKMFGSGVEIAEIIRNRIKKEIGLTVSIGVSFSKVFAKLGSDLKKPDAVTEITKENFKEKIWPIKVGQLLFVGKSTLSKLNNLNVMTIGDLAKASELSLKNSLGKWGAILKSYALGTDDSPVINAETESVIKSVGNSMTSYRDLENVDDIKLVFYFLADSVITRVINNKLGRPTTLSIYVRDNNLESIHRQIAIKPTLLIDDICKYSLELFNSNYVWNNPVRSLGISVSNFVSEPAQTDIFTDAGENDKKERAEKCVALIKDKYNVSTINRGIAYTDKKMITKKLSEKPIFK